MKIRLTFFSGPSTSALDLAHISVLFSPELCIISPTFLSLAVPLTSIPNGWPREIGGRSARCTLSIVVVGETETFIKEGASERRAHARVSCPLNLTLLGTGKRGI